jgi:hypothetical protein
MSYVGHIVGILEVMRDAYRECVDPAVARTTMQIYKYT